MVDLGHPRAEYRSLLITLFAGFAAEAAQGRAVAGDALVRKTEDRQEDDAAAWGEPVGDAGLLGEQVEPQFLATAASPQARRSGRWR
jgi:hypothetical protein